VEEDARRTSPAGQAIPPHPGPASTFNLTGVCRSGISKTVSSEGIVKNARVGASDSNDGKATLESVEEMDRGESGMIIADIVACMRRKCE